MNRLTHPMCSRGFTLIEILIAMLVLAVVSVGIISLNGQLFWQSANMYDLQRATQIQQACVEKVLAKRQISGYSAALDCSEFNIAGVLTVSVSQPPNDANTALVCPTGLQCKRIDVTVSGQVIQPAAASLLFVNY